LDLRNHKGTRKEKPAVKNLEGGRDYCQKGRCRHCLMGKKANPKYGDVPRQALGFLVRRSHREVGDDERPFEGADTRGAVPARVACKLELQEKTHTIERGGVKIPITDG